MKKFRSLILLMAVMVGVSFMSVGTVAAAEMPGELQAVVDKAKSAAGSCAEKLNGAWGDQHVALMASEKGKDFADFKSMQTTLNGQLAGSGATYIYVIYPSGAIEKEPFFITVDGSAEPDDYGTKLDWEVGFAGGWNGITTAADKVAKDDNGNLLLSVYSPVRDSKGDIVAVLGVDFPAPEAANFPEWIESE